MRSDLIEAQKIFGGMGELGPFQEWESRKKVDIV